MDPSHPLQLLEISDLALPPELEGRATTFNQSLALTKHLTALTPQDIKTLVKDSHLAKHDLEKISECLFLGSMTFLGLGVLGLTIFIFSPFFFTAAALGYLGSRFTKKLAHWRYKNHAIPPLREQVYEDLDNPLNKYAAELKEAVIQANAQFALWNHRVAGLHLEIDHATQEDVELYQKLLSIEAELTQRVTHLKHVHELEKIRQELKNRGLDVDHMLTELDLHLKALATQGPTLLDRIIQSNAEDQLALDSYEATEDVLKTSPENKIAALEVDDVEIDEKIK